MLKKNTKKEKKTKEENKKKSIVPRYITFLILSIILGGIFTALTSYAATIAATNISYSNSTSGLTATNAQSAIDELYNSKRKFQYGDIVYFEPTNTSYTIDGTKYGLSSSYTYNPSELKYWIISRTDQLYVYASSLYMPSNPVKLSTVNCSSKTLTSSSTTTTHKCLLLFSKLDDFYKELGSSYGVEDKVSGCYNVFGNLSGIDKLKTMGLGYITGVVLKSEPYVKTSLYGGGSTQTSGLSVNGNYYAWTYGISNCSEKTICATYSGDYGGYYKEYVTMVTLFDSNNDLSETRFVLGQYARPYVQIKKSAITSGFGTMEKPFLIS